MGLDTQTLLERLTTRLDLDRIFMATYDFLGMSQTHLLLVMNPISGLSPKVMLPVVELCLMDQPPLSFEIIPFGDWKNKLNHGSLFYAFLSLPQHRLYASERKVTKNLTLKELRGVSSLFTEIKTKLDKEASDFLLGSRQFQTQQNYLKAGFMLHQSMKLSLSLLQSFVLAKTNRVPNLVSRIRALCNQFPMLRSHFLNNEFVDQERLNLLDKVYGAVKQNRDLEITEEDFLFLSETWLRLQGELENLYSTILQKLEGEIAERQNQQHLQEKCDPLQKTPTKDTPLTSRHTVEEDFSEYPWPKSYKADVNNLIDHIQKNHNPEQIILLNYRTGEFSGQSLSDHNQSDQSLGTKVELYLIVIMKKRGPIRQRGLSFGKVSALALFFEVEKFKQKLSDNQSPDHRFYVNTIRKGIVVRKKNTFDQQWAIAPIDWAKQHWHAKFYFAASYQQLGELAALVENVNPSSNHINSLMLGHLIDKGINTFLRMFLGYTPKDISLDQLIDFTTVVDNRILDYLTPRNKTELDSLATILDYQRNWRNGIHPDKLMPMEKSPKQFSAGWLEFIYNLCIQALEYMEGQTR